MIQRAAAGRRKDQTHTRIGCHIAQSENGVLGQIARSLFVSQQGAQVPEDTRHVLLHQSGESFGLERAGVHCGPPYIPSGPMWASTHEDARARKSFKGFFWLTSLQGVGLFLLFVLSQ
jgi:hypothetical protein